jgi:hypothetical protein
VSARVLLVEDEAPIVEALVTLIGAAHGTAGLPAVPALAVLAGSGRSLSLYGTAGHGQPHSGLGNWPIDRWTRRASPPKSAEVQP